MIEEYLERVNSKESREKRQECVIIPNEDKFIHQFQNQEINENELIVNLLYNNCGVIPSDYIFEKLEPKLSGIAEIFQTKLLNGFLDIDPEDSNLLVLSERKKSLYDLINQIDNPKSKLEEKDKKLNFLSYRKLLELIEKFDKENNWCGCNVAELEGYILINFDSINSIKLCGYMDFKKGGMLGVLFSKNQIYEYSKGFIKRVKVL